MSGLRQEASFRVRPVADLQLSRHAQAMFGKKHRLDAVRRRATSAVISHARAIVPGARGFSFGAIDVDPKHLAVWITTATDAERDQLASDTAVAARFREILAEE